MNLLPIILCGGSGTRLWPLSRQSYPKQFINLCGDQSLLQATAQRLTSLDCLPPLAVCLEDYRFLAAEQLRLAGISAPTLLLEPQARNTAPAMLAAACYARRHYEPQTRLLFLPADHVIGDEAQWAQQVQVAADTMNDHDLVTFGVVPSRAETGYGYLQTNATQDGLQTVQRFVEKPDEDTAQRYLDQGGFYWNSGIFLTTIHGLCAQALQIIPDTLAAAEQSVRYGQPDGPFWRLDAASFDGCPAESIDYALMEKSHQVRMMPLDVSWSDVGAWDAVCEQMPKDSHGNVCQGDVLVHQVTNSYCRAESRLMTVVGLDNVVAVETEDALLIAHRDAMQQVKQVVGLLQQQNRPEVIQSTWESRFWGRLHHLENGRCFRINQLTLALGDSIAQQRHHHRSEHWVVTQGTLSLTLDNQQHQLIPGQSACAQPGQWHSLANHANQPLELLEIQVGEQIKANDIERG